MKISDYSIIEYLSANSTETRKIGNQIVCRCPVCKGDNDFKAGHNCQINVEKNTIYCHSGCGTFTRTRLVDALNLRSTLDIPVYIEKDEFKKVITIRPEAPGTMADMAEIERLLSSEIPPIFWDKDAKSFKNISVLKNYHGNGNRLIFKVSADGKVIRNGIGADGNNIKWKWSGNQPVFTRLNNKKLIFIASGVAEWLILDWLGLDYIVLPSDSLKERIKGFKEQLKDKAVIILPDKDLSGSFLKVIDTVKQNANRVHVAGIYPDHDFRDYCCRTAGNFANKQEFIDALKLNIFADAGGSESADNIGNDDIYNLIPEQAIAEIKEQDEPDEYDKTVLELLIEVRPELILNKFYKKTLSIVAGNSGSGKTYIILQEAMKAALSGKKVCLWAAEDIGFLGQRLKETINFFGYSKDDIAKINNNLIIRYTVAKPIFKNDYGRKKDDEAILWFVKYIADRKLDLHILDSFNRFSSGLQESMPSEIGEFMNVWAEIALKTNCAVVFLHHLSQAGLGLNIESTLADKQAAIRGAGSILATARSSYIFMGDDKVANKKYLQGVNVNHLPTGKIEEYFMPFHDAIPELENQTINYKDDDEDIPWQVA